MLEKLKNVVVIGGSYVGLATVNELMTTLPATHRILLVEPHSHFHHLFAFPRFSILPQHEHKAFIPYSAVFASAPNPSHHAIVKAKAVLLENNLVSLDREWQGSKQIPFEYAVIATGTRLPAPGSMEHDEKPQSVEYFQKYQQWLQKAKSVVIVGGGAVGVQMATDLKEIYPEKVITLVHSRDRLMPLYHPKMDEIIRHRFSELGINLITGTRAVLPPPGTVDPGRSFDLELKDGRSVRADLVIPATGQIPNNQFLQGLKPSSESPILNAANGFIRVRPSLQFQDPEYSHLFAVGDIADSGAHKAARPGVGQASVVAKNLLAMIEGREPSENVAITPPAIHLSLGLKQNIVFRNPDPANGQPKPVVKMRDDGADDMKIDRVWEKRGVKVTRAEDYHL